MIGFALDALATGGLVVPAEPSPLLVTVSAVASMDLLAVLFDTALLLGWGINLVLLAYVVVLRWAPPLTQRLVRLPAPGLLDLTGRCRPS